MGDNLPFGIPVAEGSVVNKTLAYFVGPHDFLSRIKGDRIKGDRLL